MEKALLSVIALLLVICSVSAQEFYADMEIEIDESGKAFFSGTTNHPDLNLSESDEFTSKQGKNWIFALDFNEVFSDYIFFVALPENASVNYLKAPRDVRIESVNGRIYLKGIGSNQSFYLMVQYSIKPKEEVFPLALALGGFFAVIAGLAALFLLKPHFEPNAIDKRTLTERQLAIIEFIQENKGAVSQKHAEEELGIPKASLSRNVESLVKKGYLKKEQKGMTNMLFIKNSG